MSENSRSRVTITLGRTGQVVKRDRSAFDSSYSDLHPVGGRKRSIKDRLGSNVDSSGPSYIKRLREDGRATIYADEDSPLRKDDLRYKIMQKQFQNSSKNKADLRTILSRPAQSSTNIFATKNRIPEPNNTRSNYLDPRQLGLKPATTNSSMISDGPAPINSNSYSPWTLDRLRRRSPDEDLEASRSFQEAVRDKELGKRFAVGSNGDDRISPYISKSRLLSSSSYLNEKTGQVKGVAPVTGPLSTPSNLPQKSSYAVDDRVTVDRLLHSLDLEKFAIVFKAEEVDMYTLKRMTERDLKEMGIPMGPRKKILLALQPHLKRKA